MTTVNNDPGNESAIRRSKAASILPLLDRHYPNAHCTLDYRNPLELLVATILSAQCTDERVNQVTPELFRKYPDAAAFARAPLQDLESAVHSTGFFRNKAKSIQACCRVIEEQFRGQVPSDLGSLVKLPGIGRKTANVILGNAFQIPGVVVDTHVGRVAQRLGLTTNQDPGKIESDLMEVIPRDRWVIFSHQLILHGRTLCLARKPLCPQCPLQSWCDFFLQAAPSAGTSSGTRRRRSKL